MEKKIMQHQPYSHIHTTEYMSLSDRFSLINRVKNLPLDQLVIRKSKRKTGRSSSAASNVQTKISGRSIFSRIGVAANQNVSVRVQGSYQKKKKARRIQPKNYIKPSKVLKSKPPVIKEKIGNTKVQGEDTVPSDNLKFNSTTKETVKLQTKKRKVVVDANDLDKELEEYMAAAPYASYDVSSPKVKDELTDVIDLDIDFMDIDE